MKDESMKHNKKHMEKALKKGKHKNMKNER